MGGTFFVPPLNSTIRCAQTCENTTMCGQAVVPPEHLKVKYQHIIIMFSIRDLAFKMPKINTNKLFIIIGTHVLCPYTVYNSKFSWHNVKIYITEF